MKIAMAMPWRIMVRKINTKLTDARSHKICGVDFFDGSAAESRSGIWAVTQSTALALEAQDFCASVALKA